MVGGRKEPFEGVVLGPLLGKGSFGRVYRALWDGNPVAVKVRTLCFRPSVSRGSCPRLNSPPVLVPICSLLASQAACARLWCCTELAPGFKWSGSEQWPRSGIGHVENAEGVKVADPVNCRRDKMGMEPAHCGLSCCILCMPNSTNAAQVGLGMVVTDHRGNHCNGCH